MEKIGISRTELAQKIRKLMIDNRNIQKYEKIDDNFLIDYYFDNYDKKNNKTGIKIEEDNFDLKLFEEDFKRHLLNEKKLLEEEGVDTDKITKIVSAFSHSFGEKKSILEDLPFEKDLKIFPNIETLYLLYTEQTKNKFLEYKETSKYRDIVKIEGVLIDTGIDTLYRKVINLILEGKISKNNTVLDTTLGLKEIGIVFYKISVEKQIKSINWRETMLSNYKPVDENNKDRFVIEKGQGPRMSLVTKLNLMKDPLEESNRIYRKINENIMKANCQTVSDLYEVVGIDDLRFFYEEIGKLFNYFKMLEYNEDIEDFYNDLNKGLRKIFEYKFLPENISRLREYVKYLLRIVYRVENDNINWLKFSKNIFGITENEIINDEEEKAKRALERKGKETFDLDLNYEDSEIDDEEISIDGTDYFFYLLLKQAVFEKVSSYYFENVKNILKDYYEEEKVEKIISIVNSKDKKTNEKIKQIKGILFDEFSMEYELEEFEIPNLADMNIGLIRYKGGVLDVPFEDEGKLEMLKINLKEESFIRKKDKRDEFDISNEKDRKKLKKKIEVDFTLEKICDKYDKGEIELPFKISEKSDIVEIQNKTKKVVTKTDRKTQIEKIFFHNPDAIINAPIVELFNNIEKNKFEISKKDMEGRFKIKDQNVTKLKKIITGLNQVIRRKIEEKFPEADEIEDFIIYENGLKINLKYR